MYIYLYVCMYGMVWYGMVWYGMLCYVVLCYVMLSYFMLCYVMYVCIYIYMYVCIATEVNERRSWILSRFKDSSDVRQQPAVREIFGHIALH